LKLEAQSAIFQTRFYRKTYDIHLTASTTYTREMAQMKTLTTAACRTARLRFSVGMTALVALLFWVGLSEDAKAEKKMVQRQILCAHRILWTKGGGGNRSPLERTTTTKGTNHTKVI